MKIKDFQGAETRGDPTAMTNNSGVSRETDEISTKRTYSKTLTKAVSQNINVTEADI